MSSAVTTPQPDEPERAEADTEPASKPKPKAKPKAKQSRQGSDTKTPWQWCLALGEFTRGRGDPDNRGRRNPTWRHNCAAALHGWDQHAHDEDKPIQLTQSAYEGALKAVESMPLRPHSPALSKWCGHSFNK